MKILFFSLISILTIQCKQVDANETVLLNMQSETQEPIIKVLPKESFKAAISGNTVQLIDVRTPEEYIDGHIEGALNINVQDQKFAEQISKLDKTKTVYIYCRSGSRSQMAASQMKTLGFKSIIDLKGGYMNY
jgi:rhodanese-related sulfurtransferase